MGTFKGSSSYLKHFVETYCKVGDTFTAAELVALVRDDPDHYPVTRSATCNFLTKQIRFGAFVSVRTVGVRPKAYKLVDPDMMRAQNRTSIGSVKGRGRAGGKQRPADEIVTLPGKPQGDLSTDDMFADSEQASPENPRLRDLPMPTDIWKDVPVLAQQYLATALLVMDTAARTEAREDLSTVPTEVLMAELRKRVK